MKKINFATVALFAFVCLLSFVMSYQALQITANSHGKAGVLSYIWPMLIDGGLIIFSLSIVRSYLYNESTSVQWWLVGLFTLLTIYFNIVQAPSDFVSRLIAGSAPVVMVLTFERLMAMLRSSVKRGQIMAEITELDAKKARLTAEIDKLSRKLDRTTKQVVQSELTDRQDKIIQLIDKGVTSKTDLATQLNVSRSTVYNELNTLQKRGIIDDNGAGLEVMY